MQRASVGLPVVSCSRLDRQPLLFRHPPTRPRCGARFYLYWSLVHSRHTVAAFGIHDRQCLHLFPAVNDTANAIGPKIPPSRNQTRGSPPLRSATKAVAIANSAWMIPRMLYSIKQSLSWLWYHSIVIPAKCATVLTRMSLSPYWAVAANV